MGSEVVITKCNDIKIVSSNVSLVIMQQKNFLTSRKRILQKCKDYLKKYGQHAWTRRSHVILALFVFYLCCKFILYLWFMKIPKDEPSILCSFGRGNKIFCQHIFVTVVITLNRCNLLYG